MCCPPRSSGSRWRRRRRPGPFAGSGTEPRRAGEARRARAGDVAATTSRPVCTRPSKPQWRARTRRSSSRPTGQPRCHESPVIVARSDAGSGVDRAPEWRRPGDPRLRGRRQEERADRSRADQQRPHESGWPDSNRRPPVPKTGALARLSYTPRGGSLRPAAHSSSPARPRTADSLAR